MARHRKVQFFRVTPETIRAMSARKAVAFTVYFRGRSKGQVERYYSKLLAGGAGPENIVRELFAWLSDPAITFETGAIPAVSPDDVAGEGDWLSWEALAERMARPFRDNDAMYLDDPDENIKEIVESWYATIGLLTEPGASRPRAIEVGAGIRGMSVAAASGWLGTMYVPPYRTIMFAADRGERVGAFIALPVTREVYEAIAGGRMRPEEITPARLAAGDSRYVWIETLTAFGKGFDMTVADRSRAERHTFMYMLAYFTRAAVPRRAIPFAVAGNPLYDDRLERHGFTRTGHAMKGTNFPVRALLPRTRIPGLPNVKYLAMLGTTRPYYMYNRKVWAAEDAARTN